MDIQRIRNSMASFIGGLKKKKRYSSGLDRISPERVNMQINVLNRAVEDALYLPNPDRLKLLEIYINTWKDSQVISEHEKAEAFLITEPFEVGKQGTDTEDKKRTDLFKRPWFTHFLTMAMDLEFWGYQLIEFQEQDEK